MLFLSLPSNFVNRLFFPPRPYGAPLKEGNFLMAIYFKILADIFHFPLYFVIFNTIIH